MAPIYEFLGQSGCEETQVFMAGNYAPSLWRGCDATPEIQICVVAETESAEKLVLRVQVSFTSYFL